MLFYIKLAWRNIFRNKRRTIIAGVAIGIGLAALIFTDAFMIGMERNMIASITSSYLGDAQIHAEGFRESQEAELTVNRASQVLEQLQRDQRVKYYAPRNICFGMVKSASNSSPVLITGIDPGRESSISEVDDQIEAGGEYLKDLSDRGIILGKKLAEILEVKLGDRVVLTVAQVESGDNYQEMLRIKGIFDLGVEEVERGIVYISLNLAQKMLNLQGRIHEIALKFHDPNYALTESTDFTREYSRGGNEAANWPTIFPQMKMILQMRDLSIGMIGIIIFGVVIFGIINTLFMSLYERMFEFGVLRAIGTRGSGIKRLIVLEAGALGIVSVIVGLIIGFLLTLLAASAGIDYRGIEFAGTHFTKILYPVMELRQFIFYPIMVLIFTVLVSIYPAVKASRMKVAEALRKSF